MGDAGIFTVSPGINPDTRRYLFVFSRLRGNDTPVFVDPMSTAHRKSAMPWAYLIIQKNYGLAR